MYNKKYIIEKIEEFNHHNPIYDYVEGLIAYPAYFCVGERGWFLYIRNGYANRIHTSVVQFVKYTDDTIILMTENTKITFRLVNEYDI